MGRRGGRGAGLLILIAAVGAVACARPAATRGDAQAPSTDHIAETAEPAEPAEPETATRPPAHVTVAVEDQTVRGRHVGRTIGVHYGRHPDMSTLALPDGMRLYATLAHADGWRLVVAEQETNLVVFLTDDEGVVTDDLLLAGAASDSLVTFHCGEDISVSLIAADGCADEHGSTSARRTWLPRAGALVEVEAGARCDCDML